MQFRALEFRVLTKNEPFSQLLHSLYIYPLAVNQSRKRNLYLRLELRKDDVDIRNTALEVRIFLKFVRILFNQEHEAYPRHSCSYYLEDLCHNYVPTML